MNAFQLYITSRILDSKNQIILAYDINLHDTYNVKGVEYHPGKSSFVSWERNHLCISKDCIILYNTKIILYIETNYEIGRGDIWLLAYTSNFVICTLNKKGQEQWSVYRQWWAGHDWRLHQLTKNWLSGDFIIISWNSSW